MAGKKQKIKVLVSGLPGKMASEAALEIYNSNDLKLMERGFGLEDISTMQIKGVTIPHGEVIGINRHHEFLEHAKELEFIIVDFTQPDSALMNAALYAKYEKPFVMGTTMKEEDRGKIDEIVKNSKISALIAPNMSRQIVALQSCMQDIAKEYEGRLRGFSLGIIESHQQGKKDTSGTARAFVKYFNQLGINFDVSQIKMIRDPKEQELYGIPEEHLGGHGWHTYIVTQPEGKPCLITHYFIMTKLMEKLNKDFPSALKGMQRKDRTGQIYSYAPYDITYNERAYEKTDDSVALKFGYTPDNKHIIITHNINGRKTYAEGTAEAVRYLHNKVKSGSKGEVFSMIDVLKGR